MINNIKYDKLQTHTYQINQLLLKPGFPIVLFSSQLILLITKQKERGFADLAHKMIRAILISIRIMRKENTPGLKIP